MGMREKLMDIVCESIATDRCMTYCNHPHCGLVHTFVRNLIASGVTIPVRCKDCKHGIWDEDEGLWKCVYSSEFDEQYGEWFGFTEYNDGLHFCSYGERRTDDST